MSPSTDSAAPTDSTAPDAPFRHRRSGTDAGDARADAYAGEAGCGWTGSYESPACSSCLASFCCAVTAVCLGRSGVRGARHMRQRLRHRRRRRAKPGACRAVREPAPIRRRRGPLRVRSHGTSASGLRAGRTAASGPASQTSLGDAAPQSVDAVSVLWGHCTRTAGSPFGLARDGLLEALGVGEHIDVREHVRRVLVLRAAPQSRRASR